MLSYNISMCDVTVDPTSADESFVDGCVQHIGFQPLLARRLVKHVWIGS